MRTYKYSGYTNFTLNIRWINCMFVLEITLKLNKRLLRIHSIRSFENQQEVANGLKKWKLDCTVILLLLYALFILFWEAQSAENRLQIRVHQTASGSRNRAERHHRNPASHCLRSSFRSHRETGDEGGQIGDGQRVGSWGFSILPRALRLDRSRLIYPHDRFPTTIHGFGLVYVYIAYTRGRYHLRRADRPPPPPRVAEDTKAPKL